MKLVPSEPQARDTPDIIPPLRRPEIRTKSPDLRGYTTADITVPKPKPALVADLFCGAGGSSTGAKRALAALGYRMNLLCVNHWPTAIDTHTRNHPEARHYCQDVSTVRPHIVVREGRLDLLMASPTCTFHSRARGGKPISDQQRMDPWHIITWLTELRVKRLIIENVPEFVRWGPCNARTGRPIKSREGEYFVRWVETIRSLGFDIDWRILNAANYGDATTRERFFLIARSDKGRLHWPDATHAPRQTVAQHGSLLGPALKPWRPAREVIDWELQGRSIFNRPIPLSPRTLERILAGAIKLKWPELYVVAIEACALIPALEWALERARQAIAGGAKGKDLKRAQKMLDYGRPRLRQLRRKHIDGTAVRMPDAGATRSHSIDDPMPTADCRGAGYLVQPTPMILSGHAGGAPRDVDDPMPGMTAKNNGPFMVATRQHTGGPAPRDVNEPVPTICATDSRIGVVEPMLAPYYGEGSGKTGQGVTEPVHAITTKGRFGLVVPVTNSSGGPEPRSVDDPLPTLTTAKGGEFAMVTPVTHHDGSSRARSPEEPLPTITCAPRGDLAFIAASFGERDGQAPRIHTLDNPMPTLCAEGRIQLVQPGKDFDVLFRMLEPHELASAMGFNEDDQRYEFSGTKTDVIKQIGNAVPCNTAAALVRALFEEVRP